MDATEQRDRMVICLAALASPIRLDIFRLLVEQEPVGLVSGEIAEYLEQTHNGISFHLKSLQHAGLVTVQPGGAPPTLSRGHARSPRPSVAYLSENCCGGPDTIDADRQCQAQRKIVLARFFNMAQHVQQGLAQSLGRCLENANLICFRLF